MKILLTYLKPFKWLVALALLLAAINQTFSMLDPYFFGKLFDKYATHPFAEGYFDAQKKFIQTGIRTQSQFIWGIMGYLGILISVAMISRIAKAFQDYFSNVVVQKFGAKIFTDGLKHSMALPYQDFEDQRSGETLSILSKVRLD
ncbi:MAG: ABC transporter transmembrane domain-containing protein, partial [Chitinophagaceae bacterium]